MLVFLAHHERAVGRDHDIDRSIELGDRPRTILLTGRPVTGDRDWAEAAWWRGCECLASLQIVPTTATVFTKIEGEPALFTQRGSIRVTPSR